VASEQFEVRTAREMADFVFAVFKDGNKLGAFIGMERKFDKSFYHNKQMDVKEKLQI